MEDVTGVVLEPPDLRARRAPRQHPEPRREGLVEGDVALACLELVAAPQEREIKEDRVFRGDGQIVEQPRPRQIDRRRVDGAPGLVGDSIRHVGRLHCGVVEEHQVASLGAELGVRRAPGLRGAVEIPNALCREVARRQRVRLAAEPPKSEELAPVENEIRVARVLQRSQRQVARDGLQDARPDRVTGLLFEREAARAHVPVFVPGAPALQVNRVDHPVAVEPVIPALRREPRVGAVSRVHPEEVRRELALHLQIAVRALVVHPREHPLSVRADLRRDRFRESLHGRSITGTAARSIPKLRGPPLDQRGGASPSRRSAKTPRWFATGRSRPGMRVWKGLFSGRAPPSPSSTTSVVEPPPSRLSARHPP